MPVRKLVRDRIPEILEREGKKFRIIKQVQGQELIEELIKKLQEEVEEFIKNRTLEELADILEVVDALAKELGADLGKVLEIKERKRLERGGFTKGIVIELE